MGLSTFNGKALKNGIWYDSYTRVFSIGGNRRVVEVSNFPRACKDKVPHVYEKDTEFTVSEDDLNGTDENGVRCYFDMVEQKPYYLKDKAVHHAGEGLPGAFPRWVEYKEAQSVTKEGEVYLEKVPKPFTISGTVKALAEDTKLSDITVETAFPSKLAVKSGRQICYFEAIR